MVPAPPWPPRSVVVVECEGTAERSDFWPEQRGHRGGAAVRWRWVRRCFSSFLLAYCVGSRVRQEDAGREDPRGPCRGPRVRATSVQHLTRTAVLMGEQAGHRPQSPGGRASLHPLRADSRGV